MFGQKLFRLVPISLGYMVRGGFWASTYGQLCILHVDSVWMALGLVPIIISHVIGCISFGYALNLIHYGHWNMPYGHFYWTESNLGASGFGRHSRMAQNATFIMLR